MNRGISCLVSLMGWVGCAWGQVGQTQENVEALWGHVRSGTLNEKGSGTLQFERQNLSLKVTFDRERVKTLRYQSTLLSEVMVLQLLAENSGEAEWDRWVPPGIVVEPVPGEGIWMRNDELARAVWKDHSLVIEGALFFEEPPPQQPEAKWRAQQEKEAATTAAPKLEMAPKMSRPEPVPVKKGMVKPVKKPEELPEKGASVRDLRGRFGPPDGEAEVGGRKVWVYPWGKVWIVDGKVYAVDV